MRKITATIMTLLVAGLVVGCSESPQVVPQEAASAPQSAEQSPESTPAPLAATTPSAPSQSEADAVFLAYVRDNLLPDTQIPDATDEQLIEAGRDACEQLEAGVPHDEVRVIEGEQPHENGTYYDSSAIMNGAVTAYCRAYL